MVRIHQWIAPSVRRYIDECLSRGILTEEECAEAYESHLSPFRQQDLERFTRSFDASLRSLIKIIELGLAGSATFGASLEANAKELLVDAGADRLRSALGALADAATAAQQHHRALNALLVESRKELAAVVMTLDAVRAESLTDELTGLGNRKQFELSLVELIASAGPGHPLSLAIIDIDHFKLFNDTFGHSTGDQVLKIVASSLKERSRDNSIAARYGGEEFGLIMPGTGIERAMLVAEDIRQTVMSRKLKKKSSGENLGTVTISLGVAQLQADEDLHGIIERADRCLYAAKLAGRNRSSSESIQT